MTNDEHNNYLAWTFIGHGLFQLLVTMVMLAMIVLAIWIPTVPGDTPSDFLLAIFGFIFAFQTLFIAPSFVAAFALWKRKKWARVAAIVAGIVSAINVPFGTLACVYSLWFFVGENWKDVYEPGGSSNLNLPNQIAEDSHARWTGYHTDEQGEVVFHPVNPPDWR
jgi:hypothetical protein